MLAEEARRSVFAGSAPAAVIEESKLRARRAMLGGPVLETMLRLAWPTVAVILVQHLVAAVETFYVSYLGTDALAGVSLVFPVLMLMTMMSSGGLGTGVSSAIARAIGARRRDDADALVLHAIVIAAVFGLAFTAGMWLLGPILYRAMGGSGAALDAALTYSNVLFAGAVPLWIANQVAASLRGAGNVRLPAMVILAAAATVLIISPVLIFGLGPLPALGIAGAGLAVASFYAIAATVLALYMASGRAVLVLRLVPLERRLAADILRVGLVVALQTVQTNLAVILVTGAVGAGGTAAALAGYGLASRLDYLLLPLMFGLGSASLTMVGTSVGAKDRRRAWRVAWTGAFVAAAITEAIGIAAAILPTAWLGLFSRDPVVLATGALYLRIVAPAYGLVGLGFLLCSASQGAGLVFWPLVAATTRLLVAAGVGWLVVLRFGLGLPALFATVAAAAASYGALSVMAMMTRGWRPGA
jgi:putative MATE family efflux protein